MRVFAGEMDGEREKADRQADREEREQKQLKTMKKIKINIDRRVTRLTQDI